MYGSSHEALADQLFYIMLGYAVIAVATVFLVTRRVAGRLALVPGHHGRGAVHLGDLDALLHHADLGLNSDMPLDLLGHSMGGTQLYETPNSSPGPC